MDKVELSALEWYARVNEQLTLTFINMRNGIEPSENQLGVIKALYGVYYNGELPLYKNVNTTREEILSQGNLFDTDKETGKEEKQEGHDT